MSGKPPDSAPISAAGDRARCHDLTMQPWSSAHALPCEQLVRNLQALRIERLRTEVAWDDHELVAFFGRMGLVPVPRLVLEADLST